MEIPPAQSIDDRLSEVQEPWSPIDIAKCNDQVMRLAKFHGEYHWHTHEYDELFYVYGGEITIQLREATDMILRAGEIGTIPAGVEHCPKSDGDSYVLMFEPE